jgi:nucleoside-diphosphate-sugar epimerase
VTGGAGYIGCVLTELLLAEGYRVTVLDRFFFGDTLEHLRANPQLRLVKSDIRWFDASLLTGIDAVLDLAAISNDPAGQLDPAKTLAINFEGRARVCREAKAHGVKRYVLASSCSIYGFQDAIIDETSPINPLTTYAEANFKAEQANLPLADATFTATAVRQATVYGLSSRMRFDLAINGMTLGLHTKGSIPILRDGKQWRPMVHLRDTSRAFIRVLQSDPAKVNGQIFNVGSDDQNFQIYPLAESLAAALGQKFAFTWYGEPDHRSYRVSFAKIRNSLGYATTYTPGDAAKEIVAALKAGTTAPTARTKTVDWYKHLLETKPQDVSLNGTIL